MEHAPNTQPLETHLTLSFSPDPTSAFVFYGLSSGNIDVPGFVFQFDLNNQEQLQHRLLRGEVDIARVSVDTLAFIASQYFVLARGLLLASPSFGPKVVASRRSRTSLQSLASGGGLLRVGFDGEAPSAGLAFSIAAREMGLETEIVVTERRALEAAVQEGGVDIGVLSLAGTSEFAQSELEIVSDIGEWWSEKMDFPLPLSVNVCRRSLSAAASRLVVDAVDESLRYGSRYRDEAVRFASQFGVALGTQNASDAIQAMVESWNTSDAVLERRALKGFLQACAAHGLLPYPSDLAFL